MISDKKYDIFCILSFIMYAFAIILFLCAAYTPALIFTMLGAVFAFLCNAPSDIFL